MSKCILVVDDEEDVRSIVRLALEMKTDWQVLSASSGQEALNLAATHQPDLILLDVMMPEMDGRMTLQALKTNSLTDRIPVILVTAKVQPSERASLAQLDVVAVFAKPFRPLQLADQIMEVLF